MFFVKVLKSHSDDVQSCQRQRTVQERGAIRVNLLFQKRSRIHFSFLGVFPSGNRVYLEIPTIPFCEVLDQLESSAVKVEC